MGGVGPESCDTGNVGPGGGAPVVWEIIVKRTGLAGLGVGGLYRPVLTTVVRTVVVSAERGELNTLAKA